MKRKFFRNLVIVLFITLLCYGLYFALVMSDVQSGSMSNYKSDYITCTNANYFLSLYFTYSIDNSKCNKDLNYTLTNPQGKVVLKGTVLAGQKLSTTTKKFNGLKGKWILKVEKETESEENMFIFDNKFAFKYY